MSSIRPAIIERHKYHNQTLSWSFEPGVSLCQDFAQGFMLPQFCQPWSPVSGDIP